MTKPTYREGFLLGVAFGAVAMLWLAHLLAL